MLNVKRQVISPFCSICLIWAEQEKESFQNFNQWTDGVMGNPFQHDSFYQGVGKSADRVYGNYSRNMRHSASSVLWSGARLSKSRVHYLPWKEEIKENKKIKFHLLSFSDAFSHTEPRSVWMLFFYNDCIIRSHEVKWNSQMPFSWNYAS